MKAPFYLKVVGWTLCGVLLFTQIGAGFFHNKHDAHKHTVELAQGDFAISEHGEHCKLCAIDLITLYNVSPEVVKIQAVEPQLFVPQTNQHPELTEPLASNRAPPALPYLPLHRFAQA